MIKSTKKLESNQESIVPNSTNSIEGKWYEFNGKYKLDRIKKDPDPDADQHDRSHAYRLTIHFPRPPIVGIHKKEVAIVGDDYGSYGYQCFDSEVPEEMTRMAEIIRDVRRQNEILRQRNRKLEKHFSKTAWDEEREMWKSNWKTAKCDHCSEEINHEKAIEGKDFIYLSEGEIVHLECAVRTFNSICSGCGGVLEQGSMDEDDNACPECGSELAEATKDEIRKKLQFDAIQHYLPKELLPHVTYKEVSRTSRGKGN